MANPTPPPTEFAALPPEYFGDSHRPRKSASTAWSVLGWLLLTVTMTGAVLGGRLAGGAFEDEPVIVLLGALGGLLLGILLGLATAKCFIRAKRLRAPSASRILARDHRPPVVYFRPFTADVDASKPVALTSWFTEEEQLAKMMNDIGPMVAIGAPEETLPLLGAARMYVDNAKWHEAALDLAARAALTVMRIGSSPGFWWEFESVVQRIRPEKLVLLIPRNQALYEAFRLASCKLIPTVLPGLTGWEVKRRFRGNLRAVIFFDTGWVPSIVDVQTYRLPFLQRSPACPLVPVLKTALRPVYVNAGLSWTPPGINARMVFVLVAVAFLVLLPAIPWLISLTDSYSFDDSPIAVSDAAPSTTVPESRQSDVENAMQRLSSRLRDDVPEFVSRLEATRAAAGPGREEQRRACQSLGAQFSRLGMKRLDDNALLAMAALRTKMMTRADVAGCAALERGDAGARIVPILGNLDSTDVDQYLDLCYQAMRAEARQSPAARRADHDRLLEIVSTILSSLTEEERKRLRKAITKGTGGDDEETCWMGRTLQAGINKLDRGDRIQWMLAQ